MWNSLVDSTNLLVHLSHQPVKTSGTSQWNLGWVSVKLYRNQLVNDREVLIQTNVSNAWKFRRSTFYHQSWSSGKPPTASWGIPTFFVQKTCRATEVPQPFENKVWQVRKELLSLGISPYPPWVVHMDRTVKYVDIIYTNPRATNRYGHTLTQLLYIML